MTLIISNGEQLHTNANNDETVTPTIIQTNSHTGGKHYVVAPACHTQGGIHIHPLQVSQLVEEELPDDEIE